VALAVKQLCKCTFTFRIGVAPSTRCSNLHEPHKLTSSRAREGANLCLACRNPPPTEPHPEEVVEECKANAKMAGHVASEIEWWELDMSSLASVEAFAHRWLDTGRPLVRKYHSHEHIMVLG